MWGDYYRQCRQRSVRRDEISEEVELENELANSDDSNGIDALFR